MKFCTYLSYASFDAFDNETLSGSFMFVEFQLQNLEFFFSTCIIKLYAPIL